VPVERDGIVGDIPRVLAAVSAAAIETGAPVMVHTNAAAGTGPLALEALTDAGIEPTRIVIAHAGDSNDLAYLRTIADTGAWLGCDRFSIEHFNPDARRIETLVQLLANGYGDRVHLSHDAACFIDFMVGDPAFANERPDYLHISTEVLPALRQAGVTDDQIDELMVANPRRFFDVG
jgi:phosphotriesterase-related protein